jgi:hypothetical protein
MVKKKDDLPDNKYELVGFLIKKHWWKVVIIIFASGIMATGFKCTWKGNTIEKDALYKKTQGE